MILDSADLGCSHEGLADGGSQADFAILNLPSSVHPASRRYRESKRDPSMQSELNL
jgi:hypothetical protein